MAAAKTLAIRIETVDALVAKFRERWDFEAEDEKMIEDFKASLSEMKGKKTKKSKKSSEDGETAPKKKREPSPYNLFVSEKKAEILAKGFTGQEMIREAARMWNALHPKPDTKAEPEAEAKSETTDEEAEVTDEE